MGNISYGLQILLLGMGVVLITLYVLSLILQGFRLVFHKQPSGKKTSSTGAIEAVPELDHQVTDLEVIAAISAALAAYLDKPVSSFNVIRVRRLSTSDWVRAGRQELLDTVSMR